MTYRFAALSAALLACLPLQVMAETVVISPTKDSSIYGESNTQANGLGAGIFSGQTNDGFVRRGLIQFNVGAAVPPASIVTNATLRLTVTQSNTGPLTVGLHRVTSPWGEGPSSPGGNGGTGAPAETGDATWQHRLFPNTMWTTPGGDYVATASATTAVGGIGGTFEWSSPGLAADVQTWLDNGTTNQGWIIVSQVTGSGQAKRYASRENPDGAMQPVLVVDFVSSGPTGSCCLADGSCTTVLDPGGDCTGTYQGNGTSCSTTNCPQPPGACCIADADATCIQETAVDCAAQGGTFQGNFVGCAADLCPVVPTPFVDPMPVPKYATPTSGMQGEAAAYDIAFVEFDQQLHSELPATRVWGYDDGTGPVYPGPTIEALSGESVDVNWINDLRDENGALRTDHFLPMDPCPHGAEVNEARAVMHLHGAHVPAVHDGYPYSTLLPGENEVYTYPNNQAGATLWYHDHSIGTTRLGVQMGLAGVYLLRDQNEAAYDLPTGQYESPMVFQDRSFNVDGSMKYPAIHEEFVLGNTILVNGKVWPYLNVNRGKYRFRWVNGSGSRAYRLRLSNGATYTQIGSDGGFLAAPVQVSEVLMLPGERADVVMDFASYPAGTIIDLRNDAAAPYPGTPSANDIPNVLRFVVQAPAGHTAPLPAAFVEPDLPLETDANPDAAREFELIRLPGTCSAAQWTINGLMFDDITEEPQLGTSEIWEFVNKSGLAHPMHMHLVMFRVLDRQPFTVVNGNVQVSGPRVPPIATEAGYKDTVRVEPNEIVRVVATFENYVGRYAYHCHILEHEDNEMMRQFEVTTTCGDGAVGFPGEECDDGNFNGNDSCPDGPGNPCVPAFCGDGFRWNSDGGTEECDEGGVETQFCDLNCTNAACGDGDLNMTANEQCDDGNLDPGDGCDGYCQNEEPMTGGSGTGGNEPSGGNGANGSGAGGPGSGGEGALGGAGGAGGGDPAVNDGCYCAVEDVGQRSDTSAVLLALGAIALGGMRRRRVV